MTSINERLTHEHDQTVTRLEEALETEKQNSAALIESIEALEKKVAAIESRVDERLEEALERAAKAETKLKEQTSRLETLGSGREESMLALNNARDELKLVTAERDELARKLTTVEDMQTETVTFDDADEDANDDADYGAEDADEADEADEDASGAKDALPSIEDLMANLNATDEEGDADTDEPEAEEDTEWGEMIAPELIVTDTAGGSVEAEASHASQVLVGLNSGEPVEYPLREKTTTIGRGESADIQIEGGFASRIHARIFVIGDDTIIEDADSKNGTKVNAKQIDRQPLKHGDLIRIGTARFRYVDKTVET